MQIATKDLTCDLFCRGRYISNLRGIAKRLLNILKKHNIRTLFKINDSSNEILSLVNNKILLENESVYQIDCTCGKCCIEQLRLR